MAIPKTTYKGTVYLSGPITGLSYDDARFGWRATVATQLEEGIKVLSPMRHEAHLAEMTDLGKEYPEHFFSRAKVIVEKDRLDIKRSDIILVNLLGATKVSIGTVSEMGMAYEAGKQIVLVMEDTGYYQSDQFAGHQTFSDNPHDHPFVTELASLRLNNLDDAIAAINSLLSEGV